MTLIKSGTYPNKNADIGFHEFTYSIYAHPGRWQEAETVQMAYNLNIPLFVSVQKGREENIKRECQNIIPESVIQINREECFLETVKKSEDGKDWIIRLYENRNSRVNALIQTGFSLKKVEECDLLERSLGEVMVDENSFTVLFKPYEIKTFRLIL